MNVKSTKPYLIRAIHEWCMDCDYSPYIVVKVNSDTDVPKEYVQNGEIMLNISHSAANDLNIGNDLIKFMARFNGVSRKIQVPINAIKGIFAKEINQGLTFLIESEADVEKNQEIKEAIPATQEKLTQSDTRSHLQIVK